MTDINPFKIIKYQLYLLQLENYELWRYFKLLWKKGLLPKGEQRKELVWTKKAKALLLMAMGLHILVFVVAWFWIPAFAGMVAKLIFCGFIFLVLFTFYFLLFTFALLLLWPLDFLVKKIIVYRAKSKISNLKSETKIVGIAGSYGKTTMKEMLKTVLSTQNTVLSTPESVNTPVGIARWILQNLNSSVEILVVEMGEHYRGDVEEICKIVPPDISVVTGINEAHMERMGSLENTTDTVFEIVSNLKPSGLVVLNGDDKNVMENYKKYIWPDQRSIKYEVASIKQKKFNTEKLGWDLEVDGVGKVFVNLLGEYALGNVDAVVKIAKDLGLSGSEIKKGLEKIQPVDHRLQPILSPGNILVIDDAYNGNSKGVSEAIKVLAQFENRRKIFITPGLVETGKMTADVHREIGKHFAEVADVVVLIKNSVTPFIEQGIKESAIASASEAISSDREIATPRSASWRTSGLAMTKVIWFSTAKEAHESLKNILKPNDVVLFQNDWGDQYL